MNTLRFYLATAIFVLGFIDRASATIWTGTIIETVTFTTDPSYSTGQQLLGHFQYESDNINGDYGTTWYSMVTDTTANPGLHGDLYTFTNYVQNGLKDFDGLGSATVHLVVANGIATGFWANGQIGPSDYWFHGTEFGVSNLHMQTDETYLTKGTINFGQISSVADTASSVAMFSVGLLSLGAAWLLSKTTPGKRTHFPII